MPKVVKDGVEEVKGVTLDEIMDAIKTTLTHMTGVTAGGDFTTTPANLFDGDITTQGNPTIVNQYAELLFGSFCKIFDFRIHGSPSNVKTDGRWKIQYLNMEGTWTDLKTGIPSRTTNTWTDWEDFTSRVEAKGIRFVCTTYDVDSKQTRQVQVRGVKGE